MDVCKHAVNAEVALIKAQKHQELNQALCNMPEKLQGINLCRLKLIIIIKLAPVFAIHACAEKLLWHQRLGHPCDKHHMSASLASPSLIDKQLCLMNIRHAFKPNKLNFLLAFI